MKIKLAVFDFDSTLMDGETLEFLAQTKELKQQMKEITDKAMAGELDFYESLTKRVSFLKGMSVDKVNEISKNLPYVDGAKELICYLKSKGIKVVCFSGGFENALDYAKEYLGFDAYYCNFLHAKDGVLSGLSGGDMMRGTSKGEMLEKLQVLMGVTKEETMSVGDGANDLSMFKHAGLRVAFCGKKVLKDAANLVIDEKNLLKIKEYLEQNQAFEAK